MYLFDAGINILYIKELLGYEDVSTTEVYAKASIETQHRVLKRHSLAIPLVAPLWVTNNDTLERMRALGK